MAQKGPLCLLSQYLCHYLPRPYQPIPDLAERWWLHLIQRACIRKLTCIAHNIN